jgi:hypothetical protein
MHVAAGTVRVTAGNELAELASGDSCSCRIGGRADQLLRKAGHALSAAGRQLCSADKVET